MVAFFSRTRKRIAITLAGAALLLSACDPNAFNIPGISSRNSVEVALLVPQTAPNGGAEIAESFVNAARLAITDFPDVEVTLRVYDTGGQPGMASAAAENAAADGADVILGPLFGESANAAGMAVAPQGLTVISFSNNTAIAGGNVLILGNTFQNTANRLVAHAMSQGDDDIMIVHGQNTAETAGREAISGAIAAKGARLAGLASFPLTREGVVEAIPAISEQAKASGAEAIFFTSGNDGAMPFLATLLPENGIDPAEVQFIGLQRLDVPEGALQLSGLEGALFAMPDPVLVNQFSNRYQEAYGTAPHALAGLVYDGMSAIRTVVMTEGKAALTPAGALSRPDGFEGVNGIFRFLPDGTNERGLAVARIENRQVVFVEPAPTSFVLAGF